MKMRRLGVTGAALALIGGVFVSIVVLTNLSNAYLWDSATFFNWVFNLSISSLAILGASLSLANKQYGGFIALIAGMISIIFGLLYVNITQYSLIVYLLNLMGISGIWMLGITIDSILILIGGIIILTSRGG